MSAFLSPLRVELIDDTSNEGRGTWRLLEDLIYQSDVCGLTITAKAGEETDFASVPRLPLVFMVAGDRGHKAAVIHDHLYSTTPHVVNRLLADQVFKEALLVEGVEEEIADQMYFGVRFGGQSHWDAEIPAIGAAVRAEPLMP